MKAPHLTLLSLFLCMFLSWASLGKGQENTLVIKDVVSEEKTKGDKILALQTRDLGVFIKATRGKSCFLPYKEFVSDWMIEGKCRGEAAIAKAYDEEVEKVKEFFTNAKNFKITCSLRDEKVVGYSFYGHTSVKGEQSFVYRALAFDLTQYPDPEPPEPPGPVEKVFRDSFRALEKLLLPY